jgi:hypothetical protein
MLPHKIARVPFATLALPCTANSTKSLQHPYRFRAADARVSALTGIMVDVKDAAALRHSNLNRPACIDV